MKRRSVFFFVAVFMLLVTPAALMAQPNVFSGTSFSTGSTAKPEGNISFGNFKIIPSLEGQAIYNDNIYLRNGKETPTDSTNRKVSDVIYHVKPGVLMAYDLPERGGLRLGWQGDYAFYNTETANNWKNQFFNAGADYNAPGGLILKINNDFRLKEDPYGSPSQYALGRVTKRWENDLQTKLGMDWGNTFRTIALYNLYKQQYASNIDYTQNYINSEYGVSAEARISPKTWTFLRYLYGIRKYDSFYGAQQEGTGTYIAGISDDRKADNKYNQISTGLNWDPGAKLSGELSVGYMWKKFDNEFDRNGNQRTDHNTWVAATNINFDATATTLLTLNVARAVRELASDNNVYFDDTSFGVNVRQTVLTKFFILGGVTYSMNQYNVTSALPSNATASDTAKYNAQERRFDQNYILNLGLEYKIREWMTAGLAYRFWKKTSNYEIYEFDNNQLMASLRITY